MGHPSPWAADIKIFFLPPNLGFFTTFLLSTVLAAKSIPKHSSIRPSNSHQWQMNQCTHPQEENRTSASTRILRRRWHAGRQGSRRLPAPALLHRRTTAFLPLWARSSWLNRRRRRSLRGFWMTPIRRKEPELRMELALAEGMMLLIQVRVLFGFLPLFVQHSVSPYQFGDGLRL